MGIIIKDCDSKNPENSAYSVIFSILQCLTPTLLNNFNKVMQKIIISNQKDFRFIRYTSNSSSSAISNFLHHTPVYSHQSRQQLIHSISSGQNKNSFLIKQCRTWSYEIIHSLKIESNWGNSFRLLQRGNSLMELRTSSKIVISLVRKE